MNSRKDELLRKRELLLRRRADNQRKARDRSVPRNKNIKVPIKEPRTSKSEAPDKKLNLKLSGEFLLFMQKTIQKNFKLDAAVMVDTNDLERKMKKRKEIEVDDEVEEIESEEDKLIDLLEVVRKKVKRKNFGKGNQNQTFKVLENEEFDQYIVGPMGAAFQDFLDDAVAKVEKELGSFNNVNQLIEDYFYNQNKDFKEHKGGCTVRRIEDQEVEGKYMLNDVIWMNDYMMDYEKIVVSMTKHSAQPREINTDDKDYLLAVYGMDKKLITKASRSEIKRIEVDREGLVENNHTIYGGLANGKIAIWDLKSDRNLPESVSKVSPDSNFLPIIDLKKIGSNLFSIGQEGRICKWDARKLDEPIFHLDLFCQTDNNNIAQLEAMPFGFEFDPSDPDTIFVNTFEGSVYELLMTPNAFQQRSIFQHLHEAPITRLCGMDFKSFFGEYHNKKQLETSPPAKYTTFYATVSFDWRIKVFKGNFGNEIKTIKYHDDFVTALDVNNGLSPFCFATGDAEGQLAVWNFVGANVDSPVFEWKNSCAISKLRWNKTGTKLASIDINGGLNLISFPKNKLMPGEKLCEYYYENGLKDFKK